MPLLDDDDTKEQQVTDGLAEAVAIARTTYAGHQTNPDTSNLDTALVAFAGIADHARDCIGVGDDHPIRGELATEEDFDDLLAAVEKAGEQVRHYPEESPIKEFQTASDRYLALLDKLANFGKRGLANTWADRIDQGGRHWER